MNIIDKQYLSQRKVIGRLSDGSDRREIEIKMYTINVENNGKKYRLTFGHDPSEEDILTAINGGKAEEIITEPTNADLQAQIDDLGALLSQVLINQGTSSGIEKAVDRGWLTDDDLDSAIEKGLIDPEQKDSLISKQ